MGLKCPGFWFPGFPLVSIGFHGLLKLRNLWKLKCLITQADATSTCTIVFVITYIPYVAEISKHRR